MTIVEIVHEVPYLPAQFRPQAQIHCGWWEFGRSCAAFRVVEHGLGAGAGQHLAVSSRPCCSSAALSISVLQGALHVRCWGGMTGQADPWLVEVMLDAETGQSTGTRSPLIRRRHRLWLGFLQHRVEFHLSECPEIITAYRRCDRLFRSDEDQ
ncbi:hypothetical protein AB0E01_43690 [Nocardia vinacea]|uniref:hypothetical protein n=1 Tax=Nocardia vinacea TaxID=96468 RepID=UPI0033F79B39